ncbi:MAG TPA: MgtC/SapB family protein [Acidimicrobiales bacterium]|nr:MgtC/SapB family protein [Acidimicrobiales bacterium]
MEVAAALAAIDDTTFALDGQAGVRLLAAALLGGAVGLEREASDQAAGLRTHIAVALGASLFGVISTLGFVEFDRDRAVTVLQADVTRVASNVVVGIGFLGAGVIFRRGGTIRNLTTAASLWVVAAIGLACGVGDVTTAAIAAAVLLVSLVVLRPVRTYVRHRWGRRTVEVVVHLHPHVRFESVMDRVLESSDVETGGYSIRRDGELLEVSLEASGRTPTVQRWMAKLADDPDVARVEQR